MYINKRYIPFLMLSFLLTSCGGGSSSNTPSNNNSPSNIPSNNGSSSSTPSNNNVIVTSTDTLIVDEDTYTNTVPVSFYSISKASWANEDYNAAGGSFVGQSKNIGSNGCPAKKDNECSILSIHQKYLDGSDAVGVFSVQDILHDRDTKSNNYKAVSLRLKLTGTNKTTATNNSYVEDVDYDPAPDNTASITVSKDGNNCLTYSSNSLIKMIKRPAEEGYTQIPLAPETRYLQLKKLVLCPYGIKPAPLTNQIIYTAKPDVTDDITSFKRQLSEMGEQGYAYLGLVASNTQAAPVYFKPVQSKAKYQYSYVALANDETTYLETLNTKGKEGYSYVDDRIFEDADTEAEVIETVFIKDINAPTITFEYELIPITKTLPTDEADELFNDKGNSGFRYINTKVFGVSRMYALFEKASNRNNRYSYLINKQETNPSTILAQLNTKGEDGYSFRGSYGVADVFIKDHSKTQVFQYKMDDLMLLEPNEKVDRANVYGTSGYYWFPSNTIVDGRQLSMFHTGEYVCSGLAGCLLPAGL